MIEIWTEVLPKEWHWTPDKYLGGTPETVVEVARSLAIEWGEVIVYYDGPAGEYDGVYYLPRNNFAGDGIVISFNSLPPKLGKHSICWVNWWGAKQEDFMMYDERIVLSPYQQRDFGSDSRIVPLSCWPEKFINPVKVNKRCLYSSSPDRGGEFLKSIWPEVEERTGAELITTYRKDIPENEMIELYKSSKFWLHPCQGVELFCIAAVKAQVAKCVPVVVPNMALETTVKYGVKTTIDDYKEDLIQAINTPPPVKDVDFKDWFWVSQELLKNV